MGVVATHSFDDGHEEQVVNSVAWHQHDGSLCASVGDDGAIVWYDKHGKHDKHDKTHKYRPMAEMPLNHYSLRTQRVYK